MRKQASEYLELMEKFQITPNFWCSGEYFQKADLETIVYDSGNVGVEEVLEEGNRYAIFPRMHPKRGLLQEPPYWSDFPETSNKAGKLVFLDYEFLYNPNNFLNMSGGQWQVFRKNCRKFPNRRPPGSLHYVNVKAMDDPKRVKEALYNWLSAITEETVVQDHEVLFRYVYEGENRKVLMDTDLKIIYGLNIWDENYKFINYRYCFCGRENFLSEYMRWLFYTDSEILNKNKLVNDGGTLDSPALFDFKNKLNPVSVRRVYSSYLLKEGETHGQT